VPKAIAIGHDENPAGPDMGPKWREMDRRWLYRASHASNIVQRVYYIQLQHTPTDQSFIHAASKTKSSLPCPYFSLASITKWNV